MERMNSVPVNHAFTAEIISPSSGSDTRPKALWQSRKAAMFASGRPSIWTPMGRLEPLVYEGRSRTSPCHRCREKSLQVDVFGVGARSLRDLSNTWFGNAPNITASATGSLVRVLTIDRSDINLFPSQRIIRSVLCPMPTRAIWISVFCRANMPAE